MKVIALDIETIMVDAHDYVIAQHNVESGKLLRKLNDDVEKAKTAYKKEDTIAKHVAIAESKFEEASAELKDKIERRLIGDRRFSQVVCVGLCYHSEANQLQHANFYGPDEGDVLNQFVAFLDRMSELAHYDVKIITYNGQGFDLPILLARMARHNIRLANQINPRNIVDLAAYPYERFLGMSKLDDVADIYGVTVDCTAPEYAVQDFETVDLDGGYVQSMFDLDRSDGGQRVARYCSRDTAKTLGIYHAISGVLSI